ncbi:hypothetical protein ACF0H5_005841 [Mactra antiquata]
MFQRAVEHQRSLPTYATSMWLNSSQSELPVDLSQIDPIWDGGESSRASSFTGKKDSTIWGVGMEKEQRRDSYKGINEAIATSEQNLVALEVVNNVEKYKAILEVPQYATVDKTKKVPSGYWDIDVSGLGIDIANDWNPSSTVL